MISQYNPYEQNTGRHDFGILIGIDIVVAIANVVLIFGVMTTKLNHLYAWMAVAVVDVFVAITALIWLCIVLGPTMPFSFLFPLGHLLGQLLLLCLVYGMAHELRGGRFMDYGGVVYGSGGEGDKAGGSGGRGDDGWLQLNLAHATPPPPGDATAKPRSPAVLQPSVCTTAPPPALPAPAPLATQC